MDRVYLTVMIAHVSDNRLLRDDHYTLGWILFAIFLFGYGWLGWRFRETQNEEIPVGQNASAIDPAESEGSSPQVIVAAALMLASLAAGLF